MENNIQTIVDKKILGNEPSGDESRAIEMYLRENWYEAFTPLFSSIMEHFPEEYATVQDEFES